MVCCKYENSKSAWPIVKIILAIRALNVGGAERQFLELVKGLDKNKFTVLVCTMTAGSLDAEIFQNKNIRFECFRKKSRYDIASYFKYIRMIRAFNPDIIYSFLSDLNLISFICTKISFSKAKLVWGIRGSIPKKNFYGFFSQVVTYFMKLISSKADLIIYNSFVAQKDYKKAGFEPKKSTVIQNGIDSERFSSDNALRNKFREKYGLGNNAIAIGITSRIDPIKGYYEFCTAAVNLLNKYTHIVFFSIGYGNPAIQNQCKQILGAFNETRFFWLGKQLSPENIMPGWDIYCSASLPGEGFPNSIAEAMLCGLAPVVTESGDSKLIVSGAGIVAQSGDSKDLADNLEKMMTDPKLSEIKQNSRKKILQNFSIGRMVIDTENELIKTLEK